MLCDARLGRLETLFIIKSVQASNNKVIDPNHIMNMSACAGLMSGY